MGKKNLVLLGTQVIFFHLFPSTVPQRHSIKKDWGGLFVFERAFLMNIWRKKWSQLKAKMLYAQSDKMICFALCFLVNSVILLVFEEIQKW